MKRGNSKYLVSLLEKIKNYSDFAALKTLPFAYMVFKQSPVFKNWPILQSIWILDFHVSI